jgi:3-phosphoshikimate 1-carboxyvinyltransferase
MRVPGSKSLTNRALVCASLAAGTSVLTNASESDDTALMANGLNQLGILVLRKGADLEVRGGGGVLDAPKFPIPSGNAGTTLRFLLALSALARGTTAIETNDRMAERPNDDIVDALKGMGLDVRHESGSPRLQAAGSREGRSQSGATGARSFSPPSSSLPRAPGPPVRSSPRVPLRPGST